MKVVCKDSGSYHLTVGKVYKVSEKQVQKHLFSYWIVNDLSVMHQVEGNLFIKLSEYRNSKIDQICGI